MSNSAWCDLNKNYTVLKKHDMCHNPNCNCQKHITSTSKQFQMEGAGFKNTMKKVIKGTEKLWKNFIKTGLKMATLNISAGVAAKRKNPQ